MTETILILGGTKEAAELAAKMATAKPSARIISSLAGRTREPKPLVGEMRIGGFGGPEGLANWLRSENVDQVIDATHPFATQISSNAKQACMATGTPLQVRTRRPWVERQGDRWQHVGDIGEAVEALPPNGRILLALGSQHIKPFAVRKDVWFLVRMIDAPKTPLSLHNHHLLLERPSPDWRDERAMLVKHGITMIICRNSGGAGAYAKVEAARNLDLPIIMIGRADG
ncbi:MAG: cobalt-precorrin-6A reductase [Pseudomonadota bacterium]